MNKIFLTLILSLVCLMSVSLPARADGNIPIGGIAATPLPTPPPSLDGNIPIGGRPTESAVEEISIRDLLAYFGW